MGATFPERVRALASLESAGSIEPEQATLLNSLRAGGLAPAADFDWASVANDDAGHFAPTIKQAAETHAVPYPILKAVIRAESDFNPAASNPDGGRGIAQWTSPDMIRHYSVNPDDPVDSINKAAQYLGDTAKASGGNWAAALAEYNGGPRGRNAVLNNRFEDMHPITRAYLPRVLGYARQYGDGPEYVAAKNAARPIGRMDRPSAAPTTPLAPTSTTATPTTSPTQTDIPFWTDTWKEPTGRLNPGRIGQHFRALRPGGQTVDPPYIERHVVYDPTTRQPKVITTLQNNNSGTQYSTDNARPTTLPSNPTQDPYTTTTPTSALGGGGFLPTAGRRIVRDLRAVPEGMGAAASLLNPVDRWRAIHDPTRDPTGEAGTAMAKTLGIMAPINIPLDATVGAGVESATGSPRAGDVATLIAAIAPGLVRSLAARLQPMTPQGRLQSAGVNATGRELSSAADLAQRQATHGVAQAANELGEAGKLGMAREVGPRVINTANRQVEQMTKAAQRGQQAARQGAKAAGMDESLSTLNAPATPAPTFDRMTGRMVPPRVVVDPARPPTPAQSFFNEEVGRTTTTRAIPGTPAKMGTVPTPSVGRGELPPAVRTAQAAANRQSAQAVSQAQVTAPLRELDPMQAVTAVRRLAKSPDLADALLSNATAQEAQWIQQALAAGTVGKTLGAAPTASTTLTPLTAFPPSGLLGRTARVARFVAMGGGFLHGGAIGVPIGLGIEQVTERGTRALLNGMLNSPRLAAAGRTMMALDPGSHDFAVNALRMGELLQRESPKTLARPSAASR